VPQRREALERLVLHATSLRIPVVEVEGGTLTAVAGFDGHQGIALVVEPRQYASLNDILARAVERGEPPFLLILDSLEDPQNVGTLLRSAEAAGVHGVVFPTHRQAPLTPAAIKASAGAVEHLLLCPVDDLAGALSDLRIRGLRVAAAEADAPLTTAQADLRGPLAIVVGSEGQGLSPAIRRRADVAVRIPMRGAIGSLNAAVAGSILLFAAVDQRERGGGGGGSSPSLGTSRPERSPVATVAADRPETEGPAAADRGDADSVVLAVLAAGVPSDGAARPADRSQNPPTGPTARGPRAKAVSRRKGTRSEVDVAPPRSGASSNGQPTAPEAQAGPAAKRVAAAKPAPKAKRVAAAKPAPKVTSTPDAEGEPEAKPARATRSPRSRSSTVVATHESPAAADRRVETRPTKRRRTTRSGQSGAEAGHDPGPEATDLLPGGPAPD
jgi:23S rRNA (guanosine2251-2'-O)-methyltransferase